MLKIIQQLRPLISTKISSKECVQGHLPNTQRQQFCETALPPSFLLATHQPTEWGPWERGACELRVPPFLHASDQGLQL